MYEIFTSNAFCSSRIQAEQLLEVGAAGVESGLELTDSKRCQVAMSQPC